MRTCKCGFDILPGDKHTSCLLHRRCNRVKPCKLCKSVSTAHWDNMDALLVATLADSHHSTRSISKSKVVHSNSDVRIAGDNSKATLENKSKESPEGTTPQVQNRVVEADSLQGRSPNGSLNSSCDQTQASQDLEPTKEASQIQQYTATRTQDRSTQREILVRHSGCYEGSVSDDTTGSLAFHDRHGQISNSRGVGVLTQRNSTNKDGQSAQSPVLSIGRETDFSIEGSGRPQKNDLVNRSTGLLFKDQRFISQSDSVSGHQSQLHSNASDIQQNSQSGTVSRNQSQFRTSESGLLSNDQQKSQNSQYDTGSRNQTQSRSSADANIGYHVSTQGLNVSQDETARSTPSGSDEFAEWLLFRKYASQRDRGNYPTQVVNQDYRGEPDPADKRATYPTGGQREANRMAYFSQLSQINPLPIQRGANCTTTHPLSVEPNDSSHSTVDVEGEEDDEWYEQDDDGVDSDQQSLSDSQLEVGRSVFPANVLREPDSEPNLAGFGFGWEANSNLGIFQ